MDSIDGVDTVPAGKPPTGGMLAPDLTLEATTTYPFSEAGTNLYPDRGFQARDR